MARDIFFQGIALPARFVGADDVLSLLPDIAIGWPYRTVEADRALQPFYEVRAEAGTSLLRCQNHLQAGAPRHLDGVNALCDVMAALAVVLPDTDHRLISLHAAAVVVAGRLLIFPNVRRAGKSTLSVALAARGHVLVGDDVVPMSFDDKGRATAHAMGVAPRLRLPLPDGIDAGFRNWVMTAPGLSNAQYRYVRIDGQPDHGTCFADPTFVILDRSDGPAPARIEPVGADQAMDVLLFQNFTRDRHSGDVLRAFAQMLSARPVFRLSYADLPGAVRCLEQAFASSPAVSTGTATAPARPFRLATLSGHPSCAVSHDTALCQRPGTEAQRIGDTLYLADAEGMGIHRMDPLAALIWDLIGDPILPSDLVGILVEAFPKADAGQIAGDLDSLLQGWAAAGLIETSADSG